MLYSRRGVSEYWIANWQTRKVDVYRREGTELKLAVTLGETERLQSPVLPGFSCPVSVLFARIPARK